MSRLPETSSDLEVDLNFQDDCGICSWYISKLTEHQRVHDSPRKEVPAGSSSGGPLVPPTNEFELQCDQDCEICQKYIRKMSEHVKSHGHSDSSDTNVEIKIEVEDAELMDYTPEMDFMLHSDSDGNSNSELDLPTSSRKSSRISQKRRKASKRGRTREVNKYDDSDPDYKEDRNSRKRGRPSKKAQRGEKDYMCSTCGETYDTKNKLTAHERSHTEESAPSMKIQQSSLESESNDDNNANTARYRCGQCGINFSSKKTLRLHSVVHTDEKKFSCETCGKTFKRKKNLVQHERTHASEDEEEKQKHSCEECGQELSSRKNLARHMRIHSRVMEEHICEHCGHTSASKNAFASHMKGHSGVKHDCETCGRSFIRKDGLRKHMNRIHGDGDKEKRNREKKEYICRVCRRVFNSEKGIKNHAKAHNK